jgi:membrane-associated phospholipid phosphatase
MRSSISTLAIVIAWLVLAARPAHADDARPGKLVYDTRIDLAVTVTGALWLLTSETLKPRIVPEKCRWCYRAADGSDTLNRIDGGIRRNLVWRSTSTADLVSSVIAFGIEPGSQLGLLAGAAADERAIDGLPLDALLVSEATVIAAGVNQVAKFVFARERPFVHFLPRAPDGIRELTASPSDDNLSFFSGHATLAFAMATASGTVATMRSYRLAPFVWGTGLTMAAAVAYLRIAADKHYFSDVMTGAIVGSAIGVGVPLLFHAPRSEPRATSVVPAGNGIGGAAAAPALPPTFGMSGVF